MSGPCTDCGGPDYQTLEARIAELGAENASFESGARCDRDEIEGLKAERDALRHARLPCREAEVAQRRYEQAEAEVAAVGSDLQDEAEYNITLRERAEQAEAELAERDRESTDLLDAIFQTVDPEDGEEIVAEAFPKGGPAWVLTWYREHPNEEELRARAERSTS